MSGPTMPVDSESDEIDEADVVGVCKATVSSVGMRDAAEARFSTPPANVKLPAGCLLGERLS